MSRLSSNSSTSSSATLNSNQTTDTPSSTAARGTVKWFNNAKGYGFIEIEAEKITNQSSSELEVFAHFSQIIMNGYRTLKPGDAVSFEINQGPKGLNAKNIQPLFQHDPEQNSKKNNSENTID